MRIIEHSKPSIGQEELQAVSEVIKSGYLAQGEITKKFEEELNIYIGNKGGLATSTGTLALHLALLSINVKEGDQIIIPSYICRSVLNAILYCRAQPVLCDVNLYDYNICFEEAKRKITPKTKAIVVAHMFGCPAQVDKFKELGIYIIEDCAHSIGATYKGKRVGCWGDLSIFSFEGTKMIIAGEGGMVLANSEKLLDRLKKLKEPYSMDYKIKYVYRMTDIQAAVGRVQLTKLPSFIKRRKEIADRYNLAFQNLDIELPKMSGDAERIFYRYMIRVDTDIFSFMDRCLKKGIKVKQPVKPYPLHQYLNLNPKKFHNTERIMKQAVSIPIYPSLTNEEIELIINTVQSELISYGKIRV